MGFCDDLSGGSEIGPGPAATPFRLDLIS